MEEDVIGTLLKEFRLVKGENRARVLTANWDVLHEVLPESAPDAIDDAGLRGYAIIVDGPVTQELVLTSARGGIRYVLGTGFSSDLGFVPMKLCVMTEEGAERLIEQEICVVVHPELPTSEEVLKRAKEAINRTSAKVRIRKIDAIRQSMEVAGVKIETIPSIVVGDRVFTGVPDPIQLANAIAKFASVKTPEDIIEGLEAGRKELLGQFDVLDEKLALAELNEEEYTKERIKLEDRIAQLDTDIEEARTNPRYES